MIYDNFSSFSETPKNVFTFSGNDYEQNIYSKLIKDKFYKPLYQSLIDEMMKSEYNKNLDKSLPGFIRAMKRYAGKTGFAFHKILLAEGEVSKKFKELFSSEEHLTAIKAYAQEKKGKSLEESEKSSLENYKRKLQFLAHFYAMHKKGNTYHKQYREGVVKFEERQQQRTLIDALAEYMANNKERFNLQEYFPENSDVLPDEYQKNITEIHIKQAYDKLNPQHKQIIKSWQAAKLELDKSDKEITDRLNKDINELKESLVNITKMLWSESSEAYSKNTPSPSKIKDMEKMLEALQQERSSHGSKYLRGKSRDEVLLSGFEDSEHQQIIKEYQEAERQARRNASKQIHKITMENRKKLYIHLLENDEYFIKYIRSLKVPKAIFRQEKLPKKQARILAQNMQSVINDRQVSLQDTVAGAFIRANRKESEFQPSKWMRAKNSMRKTAKIEARELMISLRDSLTESQELSEKMEMESSLSSDSSGYSIVIDPPDETTDSEYSYISDSEPDSPRSDSSHLEVPKKDKARKRPSPAKSSKTTPSRDTSDKHEFFLKNSNTRPDSNRVRIHKSPKRPAGRNK